VRSEASITCPIFFKSVICPHETDKRRLLDRCSYNRHRFKNIRSGAEMGGGLHGRKFLNGQAAFQMSIEESVNAIQVSFDAAYNDAHGAAPDGEGPAKIAANGTLEFKWEDSFKNPEPTGSNVRARTSSYR
jgi:hypothetical protein